MPKSQAATPSAGQSVPNWQISGHVIVACNCDYGCPCNFNGLPTAGKCEGGWAWHVEHGSYGDVPLAGMTFALLANWPGAIHQGNGVANIMLAQDADEQQRHALEALLSGTAGGPWKILSTTFSKVHGPEYMPFEVSISGLNSRVKGGDAIEVQMQPVRNPVTKAEVHPRAILPEGFVFKDAELGATSAFRVRGPVSYDHSGRYAAVAPFDYKGP